MFGWACVASRFCAMQSYRALWIAGQTPTLGASLILHDLASFAASRPRPFEQRTDCLFGFAVVAFADVLVDDAPVPVDKIFRRPISVVVSLPGRVAVVLRHGVLDVVARNGAFETCG